MTITFSLDSVDAATRQQIVEQAAGMLAVALAKEHHQNQVYTVRELAERLQCCDDTARGLLEKGKIPYTCIGKKGYRVTELAVQNYLTHENK